jgi:hypothetical protein
MYRIQLLPLRSRMYVTRRICMTHVRRVRCPHTAAGFGWCMNVDHYAKQDCDGWNAQSKWPNRRSGPCQGVDRAACGRSEDSGCHHSQFYTIWNPITNKKPDCWDQVGRRDCLRAGLPEPLRSVSAMVPLYRSNYAGVRCTRLRMTLEPRSRGNIAHRRDHDPAA